MQGNTGELADSGHADGVGKALGLDDSNDEVTCRECGSRLGQITSSHLSRHGMTVAEYREKYPDAALQPESVREASGWSSRHDEETKEMISESIEGLHEEGHYDA